MDRIALADHAFDKHSGIDPSHSVMRLCHVAEDALLRLASLGVDRDNLAAWVTLEDGSQEDLIVGFDSGSCTLEIKIGGFAPNPQGTKRQKNKDSRCNKRPANPERPAATDRPKPLWPAPGPVERRASRACPSASSAARYKSKLGWGRMEFSNNTLT